MQFYLQEAMPERTYPLTVGFIALIFTVSMTIPFASILMGAVLPRHARWKEIVLVSSLGSATAGNRRLVLARQQRDRVLSLHFLFQDLTQYQERYRPNTDPNSQPLCVGFLHSSS